MYDFTPHSPEFDDSLTQEGTSTDVRMEAPSVHPCARSAAEGSRTAVDKRVDNSTAGDENFLVRAASAAEGSRRAVNKSPRSSADGEADGRVESGTADGADNDVINAGGYSGYDATRLATSLNPPQRSGLT